MNEEELDCLVDVFSVEIKNIIEHHRVGNKRCFVCISRRLVFVASKYRNSALNTELIINFDKSVVHGVYAERRFEFDFKCH